MGEIQMVAYNTQTGHFLKKHNNTWVPTSEFKSASGYPMREMQLAVAKAKTNYPGNWMIMRRQDADKMSRRQIPIPKPAAQEEPTPVITSLLPGVEHPSKVDVLSTCPSSEGSQQIFSLVSRLEAATSASRLQELQAQVTEYDKMVLEIYHYIEANQLNAAKGYKAYRNLRQVLLRRRAIKNELHIVRKFRNGSFPDSAQIEDFSQRLWSPDIEEMMSR